MQLLRKSSFLFTFLVSLFIFAPTQAEMYSPTEEYWRGNTVIVQFMDMDGDIYAECQRQGVTRPEGMVINACAGARRDGWHIWISNPCGIEEDWAKLMCHELSHTNGFVHPSYE